MYVFHELLEIQQLSVSEETLSVAEIMSLFHYANTPMQYTAILHSCKNVHFQMKIFKFFLFLLKTLIVGTR